MNTVILYARHILRAGGFWGRFCTQGCIQVNTNHADRAIIMNCVAANRVALLRRHKPVPRVAFDRSGRASMCSCACSWGCSHRFHAASAARSAIVVRQRVPKAKFNYIYLPCFRRPGGLTLWLFWSRLGRLFPAAYKILG